MILFSISKYRSINAIIATTLLLLSISLSSFHVHSHQEESHYCVLCVFYSSLSSTESGQQTYHGMVFSPKEVIFTYKVEATNDPSRYSILSIHAPPEATMYT